MRDDENAFDPRHPHERDGRDLPPVYDEEGRCLRCSWEYHTGEIDRLVEAVRTRDTRIAELEVGLHEASLALDWALGYIKRKAAPRYVLDFEKNREAVRIGDKARVLLLTDQTTTEE